MPRLPENLLQFIWQHRLLKPADLRTTAGSELLVLSPGSLNRDAGPDFFNARIKLNGLELAGNIELHVNTSDWLKHGHQGNKNYDTIILHVVYEHDLDLAQNTKHGVEVLELKHLVHKSALDNYEQLQQAKNKLPCTGLLKHVPDLKFTAWLERMAVERLEHKITRLEELYGFFNADYTQTVYALLLRNFGFHVNAEPFERIARHLPVRLLLKHADNLQQLEALLLGTAGLLEDQFGDKHSQQLQNEFEHLKNKYNLLPVQKEIFKFSKLRPANFPGVRLCQMALLIHTNSELVSHPQRYNSYGLLKEALQLKREHKTHIPAPGKEAIDTIIINTFAPFFFFYSRKTLQPAFLDLALDLLRQSGFEKNNKTRLFASRQQALAHAADSQGLINLYDNYCSKKQCLKCGIAASMLQSAG